MMRQDVTIKSTVWSAVRKSYLFSKYCTLITKVGKTPCTDDYTLPGFAGLSLCLPQLRSPVK